MHTWRKPEPPRESSACEGAAAGKRIISVRSGGRLPSDSGTAASNTGEGTADDDRLSRRTASGAEASPYLEEEDSVPCSSWGKLERSTLDEMRLKEVPEEPEPRKLKALYKDDDT